MKQLNISLEDKEHERLKETKKEGETWRQWLFRAADALEDE